MLTVSKLRDLEQQVTRGEISYSRMVELINEITQPAPTVSPSDDVLNIIELRWKEYHKTCTTDQFINGRFWEARELWELLKLHFSLLPQSNNSSSGEAEQIVTDLATWSEKWPRTQIYGMSRKEEMDGELIDIEERAKKYIFANPAKKPK